MNTELRTKETLDISYPDMQHQHRAIDDRVMLGKAYTITLEGASGTNHVTRAKPGLVPKDELKLVADKVKGLTGWTAWSMQLP